MNAEAQHIPQALGDLFSQILEIKQSGNVNLDDLKGILSAGAVKIIELKALHRGMCENTEALREATADAKVQLDQSSLQLQSLLYEKHHYEKEIQACTSFRSAYSDEQLELIPGQEYLAQRASGNGEDEELPSSDPHQLMLDRLHHELTSREETVKELEALKAKRDGLAADVAQRRSTLAGLDSEITRLRNSAQRVQKNYNMQVVGESEDHDQLATLLPAPLYLLYTHLKAAAAVDALPLKVSIAGEQASTLRKQMHQAMVRSHSAPANVVEATLAKAAEQACVHGNEETGIFPLTVVAAVDSEGQAATPLFSATFSYIPKVNVVTAVGANDGQDAQLASLFGEESLPAAVAGVDVATLPGVPYAWAQRVAGLDLLPPVDQLVAKGGNVGGAVTLAAVRQYQHERRGAAVAQKLVQAAQSTCLYVNR